MQGPPVVFISFKLKTPAWSTGEQPRPERQHVGKKTKAFSKCDGKSDSALSLCTPVGVCLLYIARGA